MVCPTLQAGGWAPEPSVWIEEGYAGVQAPINLATLDSWDRDSAGYIPGQMATILRLAPGAHLLPHIGPSNARLNLHYGLQIPPGAGTRIRVGNETRTWGPGKALIFDESYEHEAWNGHADQPRYVLQLHLWHPGLMPLVDEVPTSGGGGKSGDHEEL